MITGKDLVGAVEAHQQDVDGGEGGLWAWVDRQGIHQEAVHELTSHFMPDIVGSAEEASSIVNALGSAHVGGFLMGWAAREKFAFTQPEPPFPDGLAP